MKPRLIYPRYENSSKKMYSHAPKDYICPICLGARGIESKDTLLLQQDIVYKNNKVTAFINSFWIKNNPGHVIVVPNEHVENMYDLPPNLAKHIFEIAQKIALAMKSEYKCDGTTLLQNNEPAGGQHAFHCHLHIFPRYNGDELHKYMDDKQLAAPADRAAYTARLRKHFDTT